LKTAAIVLAIICVGAFAYFLFSPAPPITPQDTEKLAAPATEFFPAEAMPKPEALSSLSNPDNQPTEKEFVSKLQNISSALPTIAQLQKLTESQVHRTPSPLVAAAESLGEVEEAVEANPSLRPHAIEFYQQCAIKDELASTIRALCYHNWKTHSRETELPIPAEIRDLADSLDE